MALCWQRIFYFFRRKVFRVLCVTLAAILFSQCLLPGFVRSASQQTQEKGSDWKRLENYRTGIEKVIVQNGAQLAFGLALNIILSMDNDKFTDSFEGLKKIVGAAKYVDYAKKAYEIYKAYKDEGLEGVSQQVLKTLIGFIPNVSLASMGADLLENELTGLFEMAYSSFESQAYNKYMSLRLIKNKSGDEAFQEILAMPFGGMKELCDSYVRDNKKDIAYFIKSQKIKVTILHYPAFATSGDLSLLKRYIETLVKQELEKEYERIKSIVRNTAEPFLSKIFSNMKSLIEKWRSNLEKYMKNLKDSTEALKKAQESLKNAQSAYNEAAGLPDHYEEEWTPPETNIEAIDISPPLPTFNFSEKTKAFAAMIDKAVAEHELYKAGGLSGGSIGVPEWFDIVNFGPSLETACRLAAKERDSLYAKIGSIVTLKKHFIPELEWQDSPLGWVSLPPADSLYGKSGLSLSPGESSSAFCEEGKIFLFCPSTLQIGRKSPASLVLETYKDGNTTRVDITSKASFAIAEGSGASISPNGTIEAKFAGFVKIKATYKETSVYGVVCVISENAALRASMLQEMNDIIASHMARLEGMGIEIEDGLLQAGKIEYDAGNENRARVVLRNPKPKLPWIKDMNQWLSLKEAAKEKPSYILSNYAGYIYSIDAYSYFKEKEIEGYRSIITQESKESQYTLKVLNSLIVEPVVNKAKTAWEQANLAGKMEDWMNKFSYYKKAVESLEKRTDISQVTDLASSLDYFLKGAKPSLRGKYLLDSDSGPEFLPEYIYSKVFTEKYAANVDLEKELFSWAQKNFKTEWDLEDLAFKAGSLASEIESIYRIFPNELEMHNFKEELHIFLGNKYFGGGDISSLGIDSIHLHNLSGWRKVLTPAQVNEIAHWKEAISTVEFKRERLERLINVYKDIQLCALKTSLSLKYLALAESPIVEELKEWFLSEEYNSVKRYAEKCGEWKAGLADSISGILARSFEEGLVDKNKFDGDFSSLSGVKIKKLAGIGSKVPELIAKHKAYESSFKSELAGMESKSKEYLEHFKEILSYANEYGYIPTREEINKMLGDIGLNKFLLKEGETFSSFCSAVEKEIIAPSLLQADMEKTSAFLSKLFASKASEPIKAGSLSFLVEKDKGYWCVSVTEGKISAESSQTPSGDFNVKLDNWAYIASSSGGGLAELGPPPVSAYSSLPESGYTSQPLSGDICDKVYALLLSDGRKVKLFLHHLEMESLTQMRVVIEWEE